MKKPKQPTICRRLALVLPALLLPAQAAAGPAAIAQGIYDHIITAVGVFVLLAVLVVGFMFLLGRNASELLAQIFVGSLLIFSVGAITAAATGGAGAVAGLFVGWLRAAIWVALTFVIILMGYQFFFGKGSFQSLAPIAVGLFILLSADFLVAALGGG